jgi:hypothetical protein
MPPDAPSAPPPAQFPVRVTERGDGTFHADHNLRAGEVVACDRPTALHLVQAGFAEWTTRVKAKPGGAVTSERVLAEGETCGCAPDEAERLAKAGKVEVVKDEGQ